MNERCRKELELLRQLWPELEFLEDGLWVRIPVYEVPGDLWNEKTIEVAFQIPSGLPGQQPYAFHVRPMITLKSGGAVSNFTSNTTTGFGSGWATFSWQLDPWSPTDDIVTGTNMVNFVLSFADRLREGA